jgi:hypothetical protein
MKGMVAVSDPLSAPPKSAFLADTLRCLAKRRKAIRRKVRDIALEKVLERTDGQEREKVEITCTGPTFRLFVWDDRWVFVDARALAKGQGWTWEFTYQGRLMGGVEAPGLVKAFEDSIEAAGVQSSATLERVWKPLLASGPRPIG